MMGSLMKTAVRDLLLLTSTLCFINADRHSLLVQTCREELETYKDESFRISFSNVFEFFEDAFSFEYEDNGNATNSVSNKFALLPELVRYHFITSACESNSFSSLCDMRDDSVIDFIADNKNDMKNSVVYDDYLLRANIH